MEGNIPKKEEIPLATDILSVKKCMDYLLVHLAEVGMVPLGEMNSEVVRFKEKLRLKHPDYANYALYHILDEGFTREEKDTIKEDFAGEDSVISFVNNLVKKYKK